MARVALAFSAVALAYAVGAQVAYDWFGAGVFPVFFPAAGVTVAALVLTPRALWPAVLAGAGVAELGVDLAHGSELAPAIGSGICKSDRGADRRDAAPRSPAAGAGSTSATAATWCPFFALPVALSPALGGLIGAANAELLGSGAVVRRSTSSAGGSATGSASS